MTYIKLLKIGIRRNLLISSLMILLVTAYSTDGSDDFPSEGTQYEFVRANHPDIIVYCPIEDTVPYNYTFAWVRLFEYTDTNTNGEYDPSELIMNELDLNSVIFNSSLDTTEIAGTSGNRYDFIAEPDGVYLNISYAWFEEDVSYPYADSSFLLKGGDLKRAITVGNWSFGSMTNRFALEIDLQGTPDLSQYQIRTVTEGEAVFELTTTVTEDEDGQVVDVITITLPSPTNVIIDGTIQDALLKLTDYVGRSTVLQYNFPSFTTSLFYDPPGLMDLVRKIFRWGFLHPDGITYDEDFTCAEIFTTTTPSPTESDPADFSYQFAFLSFLALPVIRSRSKSS